MGAGAFRIIEKYQKYLNGDIVEIGSERGEGSTSFFHQFAQAKNLNFYSVDMEHNSYQNAFNIIGDNAYHMRGEDFLMNDYSKKQAKITFLYLDNFDFIYPYIAQKPFIQEQIAAYKRNGLEMNNDNSKKAHFDQMQLVLNNFLADFCYILFDDTYINDYGHFDGKGGTCVPALLRKGWVMADYNFTGQPHESWCGFYRYFKANT